MHLNERADNGLFQDFPGTWARRGGLRVWAGTQELLVVFRAKQVRVSGFMITASATGSSATRRADELGRVNLF